MSLAAALTRWRDLAFFAADAGAADAALDAIFASATVLLVLFVLFRGHALAESVCPCVVRLLARWPAAAYGAAALCLLGLAAAQAPASAVSWMHAWGSSGGGSCVAGGGGGDAVRAAMLTVNDTALREAFRAMDQLPTPRTSWSSALLRWCRAAPGQAALSACFFTALAAVIRSRNNPKDAELRSPGPPPGRLAFLAFAFVIPFALRRNLFSPIGGGWDLFPAGPGCAFAAGLPAYYAHPDASAASFLLALLAVLLLAAAAPASSARVYPRDPRLPREGGGPAPGAEGGGGANLAASALQPSAGLGSRGGAGASSAAPKPQPSLGSQAQESGGDGNLAAPKPQPSASLASQAQESGGDGNSAAPKPRPSASLGSQAQESGADGNSAVPQPPPSACLGSQRGEAPRRAQQGEGHPAERQQRAAPPCQEAGVLAAVPRMCPDPRVARGCHGVYGRASYDGLPLYSHHNPFFGIPVQGRLRGWELAAACVVSDWLARLLLACVLHALRTSSPVCAETGGYRRSVPDAMLRFYGRCHAASAAGGCGAWQGAPADEHAAAFGLGGGGLSAAAGWGFGFAVFCCLAAHAWIVAGGVLRALANATRAETAWLKRGLSACGGDAAALEGGLQAAGVRAEMETAPGSAALGLSFRVDPESGLTVREVVRGSRADAWDLHRFVGRTLVAVNGHAVKTMPDFRTTLARLLRENREKLEQERAARAELHDDAASSAPTHTSSSSDSESDEQQLGLHLTLTFAPLVPEYVRRGTPPSTFGRMFHPRGLSNLYDTGSAWENFRSAFS